MRVWADGNLLVKRKRLSNQTANTILTQNKKRLELSLFRRVVGWEQWSENVSLNAQIIPFTGVYKEKNV